MKKDHLEVTLEDISSKFELVLEGHAALKSDIDAFREESNQKHDETAFLLKALNTKVDKHREESLQRDDAQEGRLNTLTEKLDAVADSLNSPRADTEAHGRYHIRED